MEGFALTRSALAGTLIAALLTAVANMLIRVGILRFGGFSPTSIAGTLSQFFSLLLQPLFFIGFVLYFIAALVWFRTIAIAPLATAYPLMVGFTFVLVAAGGFFLWGEPLTGRKLLGLAVILAGIVLVAGARGST